jgi:hypothetical protein
MQFITLRTIITDLLNIARGANISSSEPISTRQLEDWVHQYRATLLKRDLDKGKKPNPDYIQEINHLRLEAVEATGEDIALARNESGTYRYRTVLEIPKTIDLNFTSGFTYIGTPIGEEIQIIPEGRSRWQQYKKYTPKDRVCFLKNGHLYIENDTPLEFIKIRGIFEIPSEVGRFVNPLTEQPYFNLDSKYPIPATLVPALKDIIVQKELKIETTAATDNTNDDRNNPAYPSQPVRKFEISR